MSTVGANGCCAMTKRKGTLRHCAQLAIVWRKGRGYCYYHDPENPRKFGEGYATAERAKAREDAAQHLLDTGWRKTQDDEWVDPLEVVETAYSLGQAAKIQRQREEASDA